ncbi:thioredoxin domain-containing protein [Natranaerovirga hydrolytica]|uniref:thioredoxin domain-containing protein n=1 Tax=Natranaerovirga hydrolytica TaxID=680378 RepID=UPI003FA522F3
MTCIQRTCHWCHVMEKESFEDEEVAKILNEYFISIKVDREEKPDVDHIYMEVCQALTGTGGWPLSVFLTPDKLPFYAGTYFPKHNKFGSMGFIELLENINKAWDEDEKSLVKNGERIRAALQKHNENTLEKKDFNKDVLHKAYNQLEESFENQYGGFSNVPKFPMPQALLYLEYYNNIHQEDKAKEMVEITLENMYKGGIFDHLGGGFSRYSTDSEWLVPHFEKMLYDNALLIYVYAKYYQMTQDETYKTIANQIITYVLRDMQSSEGGFYSAEDADSEGVEGLFYLWDYQEVIDILGKENGTEFIEAFNVSPQGNFEGKNILNLIHKDSKEVKKQFEDKQIYHSKEMLFQHREKRIHPYKDDKILTSWNGLMIASIAYAGKIFGRKEYVDAAKKSANFILEHLTNQKTGQVYVRFRDQEVKEESYLDDYAFFIWGLLELYEGTFDQDYLRYALKIAGKMNEEHYDNQSNSYFMTSKKQDQLGIRPKNLYDGALPSGNSVALYVMLKIARITGDYKKEENIYEFFAKHYDVIISSPVSYTFALTSYLLMSSESVDIVISLPDENKSIDEIKDLLDHNINYTSLIVTTPKDLLEDINPSLKDKKAIDDQVTYYICKGNQCNQPITNIEEVIRYLV